MHGDNPKLNVDIFPEVKIIPGKGRKLVIAR